MSVTTKVQMAARSPRVRLAVTLGLTVVIGVSSSLYAAQIAPSGVIDPELLFKVPSFWVLLVASGIWIWVHVLFLRYDESIWQFSDDEFCLAHIRKTQLEGYSEMVRQDPMQARLVEAKKLLADLKVKSK